MPDDFTNMTERARTFVADAGPEVQAIRDEMYDEAPVTIVPAGFLDYLMSDDIPDDEFNDALQRAKLRSAEVLRQLGVDD